MPPRLILSVIVGVNKDAVHQALHGYEKEHLLCGGNINRLCNLLKLRYGKSLRIAAPVGTSQSRDCFITVQGFGESKVGTIAVAEERFTSIGHPGGTLNEVFVRKGDVSQRHYVRLTTAAIHVKRFVTRGLSAFDAMDLTVGTPLSSVRTDDRAQDSEINVAARTSKAGNPVPAIVDMHPVWQNTRLSVARQILSHTRGWGGNKRFIS